MDYSTFNASQARELTRRAEGPPELRWADRKMLKDIAKTAKNGESELRAWNLTGDSVQVLRDLGFKVTQEVSSWGQSSFVVRW